MHRELKKTRREEKGEEGKEELEQGKRWRIVDGGRRISGAVCETLGSNKPPANQYRVGGQKLNAPLR